MGAVHTHLGRLDEARTDLEAALALNGQDGTRTLEAWCLHHLAQVEFAAGRLDEAEDLARQAQLLAGELGDELTVAGAQLVRGEVATQRGDFPAAEAACQQALEVNCRMGHAAGQLRVLAALSRLALAQEDAARACALAERALAVEGTSNLLLERAPLLAVYGQALCVLDDPRSEAIQAEAAELYRKMKK
ncbi:MAG: tetratricopeptide repeat protein [Caldilineae bacterium]|nr:MAG: tetratricopeptide repeat protein [Caldilineae bacterium]